MKTRRPSLRLCVYTSLTADILRHTPAGRGPMAEGWRAALVQLEALAEDTRFAHGRISRHNPYLKEARR